MFRNFYFLLQENYLGWIQTLILHLFNPGVYTQKNLCQNMNSIPILEL